MYNYICRAKKRDGEIETHGVSTCVCVCVCVSGYVRDRIE